MNTRKLITSLVAAGALSVGLGTSLSPASAGGGCRKSDNSCKDSNSNDVGKVVDNVVDKTKDTVNSVTGGGGNDSGSGDTTSGQSNPPPPANNGQGSPSNDSSNQSTQTTPTTTTSGPATTSVPAPAPRPPARRPANARPRKAAAKPKTVESVGSQAPDKPARHDGGAPTPSNPSFSLSIPGPAPVGVPNFFIEKFRIPPFLLPIYQAAGTEYGVPWQVLASINEIETDYGRNLNVSSAGAMGWMQFIPSSWQTYGVDGNDDGRKDPYNPVDAIFAAARYLKAAGADKDLRGAIFAYNHANWYVDSVMLRAKLIGGLPDDLVGALTGLTQGHFPVAARSTYADDISQRDALKRAHGASATIADESSPTRRGINIYSSKGAPVVAVNDGVVKQVGTTKALGHYVVLQDVYGNQYTYSDLGKVAPSYPSPKPQPVSPADIRQELALPPKDAKPSQPASAGRQPAAPPKQAKGVRTPKAAPVTLAKERLFAHPARAASYRAGGEQQLLESGKPVAGFTTFQAYFKQVLGLDRKDVVLRKLRPGSQVIAGTILGRIDKTSATQAPHLHFIVRPAGKGTPAIDPKPILDGWKLLESTAIYRATGKNPFFGPDARNPSIGQILLLPKEALERRLLADPRVQMYSCGRRDVQAGQIDRRVLATIEFLVSSGLKPTITSFKCGHSFYTTAGTVSEHSSGDAVDLAAINGIPIIGHQGPGSITELTIRRLLTLQGIMKPHQIISLMTFPGTDNTLSLPDHADHIHVGFQPLFGANGKLGQQFNAVLKPDQWVKLIGRLNEIDNPVVPVRPSKASIPDNAPKTGSGAHRGE